MHNMDLNVKNSRVMSHSVSFCLMVRFFLVRTELPHSQHPCLWVHVHGS